MILQEPIVNPSNYGGMKLWIDSIDGVTGFPNNAIDIIIAQPPTTNNVSNTSNTGTRPVWAFKDLFYAFGDLAFKKGVKPSIHLEGGGDWLSLDGLATATAFTCPSGITIFHTTKHGNPESVPSNSDNSALNVLTTISTSNTLNTNVGFNAGQPAYLTNEGGTMVQYLATRTDLTDNMPHNVCWTHVGTTLTCYIDGVLDSTQTTATSYNTNSGFNGIGGRNAVDGFRGGIAEVMVWDNVLTETQIISLDVRGKALWF